MAASTQNKARATKKTTEMPTFEAPSGKGKSKKVKKIPFVWIIAIAIFVASAVIGYFVTNANVEFTPLMLKINGVITEENDYAEIDLTAIKEQIQQSKTDGTPVTIEEIANSIEFHDAGIAASFFGKSLSDKVSKKFLYRKDITQEPTATDKIDFTVPGVYYIVYTCDHFAMKNKQIIKTIYVSEVELDG